MADKPDRSFLEATQRLLPELRVHCYRMLGSSHDSDDLVQETLLRAWRSRGTLKHPKMLRAWLYRIATHACLDELKTRPRRMLSSDTGRAADDPLAPIAAPVDEPRWLEPMPDSWLTPAPAPCPLSRYTLHESVTLAFVAMLQALPPVQRATLLLRDVVGMSAAETAKTLDLSVAAANSALSRARATVTERALPSPTTTTKTAEVDEAVLARYVRAFEEADIDALMNILRDDVKTTMPPSPTWIAGREGHRAFYGAMFASLHPGAVRLVRVAANGEAAFAFYRARAPEGPHLLRAIEVVEGRRGQIARIDHFMSPLVFPAFGAPGEWKP